MLKIIMILACIVMNQNLPEWDTDVCANTNPGEYDGVHGCMIDCTQRGRLCNDCCGGTACDPCAGQPCLDEDCTRCPSPDVSQCTECNQNCSSFVGSCIYKCFTSPNTE